MSNRRDVQKSAGVAEPQVGAVGGAATTAGQADDQFYYASQLELMWWRFRRHKLAFLAAILLVAWYLVATCAEFFMPYPALDRFRKAQEAPPTKIHYVQKGKGLQRPFVYAVEQTIDLKTVARTYVEQEDRAYPIRFFVRSWPYKVLGLFKTDLHLFGVDEGATVWLFGTDLMARDLFSRTLYGARVSLYIGLAGVLLTFLLGVILGGLAGYLGGAVDATIYWTGDIIRSIPRFPLLMVLAMIIPKTWPIVQTYFAITLLLSVVNWVGLARVVRARLLQLREEDFALAAKASGCSDWRIITRHLLPGFTSHLIVTLTLSIPAVILNETGLGFLGLGLYDPAVSLGVLLSATRNIVVIARDYWMLFPALFVLGTVLLFNFVGDGLRDAADPYTR